jgi:VWA domain-containing protein/HEAT repeat protein
VRPIAALVLLLAAAAALGAPASVESLRRDVQRALKLQAPGEQASALAKAFDGQDSADAAGVAIEQVFGREVPQMALEASMLAVARMQAPLVVPTLRKAADAGPMVRRLRAIEALGRSSAEGSGGALLPLVSDADAPIRAAALTALSTKGETVAGHVEAALTDPAWTVRSAAISTLGRLGLRRSVLLLCETMRTSEGRLVDDCVLALRSITGQRFGAQPERFEAWLAAEEKKDLPGPQAWQAPPWSFESPVLATRSRRILFVLCTSDTMKDPVTGSAADDDTAAVVRAAGADLEADLKAAKTKLDVARVHLRTMLRTLRDGVLFDVVVYSGSPSFVFGRPTPADASSRRRAEARIASLSPGGPGNLHGAVVRAFDPHGKDPYASDDGLDTVVLFSDGALMEPGSEDPTEVAGSARRWNAVRQIRFLVVGTGQSDPTVLTRLASGPPEGVSTSVP